MTDVCRASNDVVSLFVHCLVESQFAKFVIDRATGNAPPEPEVDLKKRGRKGGLRGGPSRAERLAPQKRTEIAKKAAEARWKKRAT